MWSLVWLLAAATPSDGRARMEGAAAQERGGDDLGAIASLETLIRDRPGWELPRLEAARLRLKRGEDLDLAQAHLEAARTIAPENPRGQYLWGLLMIERGQVDAAIAALELALHYRPDYDDARFRLAGLCFTRGEWARAEDHYRILARANPVALPNRLQLATALERQGKLEDAEIELRKLVDAMPRSPVVGQRLAEFYDRTGRPKLAEKVRADLAPKKPKKMRPLQKSRR